MTGTKARRIRRCGMFSGRPRKVKTTMEMIITKKRKLVPQRGCRVLNGRAPSGVSGRLFSKAWIDLCSAP